MFTNLIIYRK